MLMAEDALLLLVDDGTGRFLAEWTPPDTVLAGAALVQLVAIERVGFAPEDQGAEQGRMVVLDPTPPGDPLLDHAQAAVAARRPATPSS
jgi:hypothetical protein